MVHKDSLFTLVSVLMLITDVCVSGPILRDNAGQECNACSLATNACGIHGNCTNKIIDGFCHFECVCNNGGSGVGCQRQNVDLPNAPVIRERLQVKINPIDSLDFGLFGDHLFNPDFFHNAGPPKPTTTTTTSTKPPTTTTLKTATTTTPTPMTSTPAAKAPMKLSPATPKPAPTTTSNMLPLVSQSTPHTDSSSVDMANSAETVLVDNGSSLGTDLGATSLPSNQSSASASVGESVKPPTDASFVGSMETLVPVSDSREALPSLPSDPLTSGPPGFNSSDSGGGGISASLSGNNTLGMAVDPASGSDDSSSNGATGNIPSLPHGNISSSVNGVLNDSLSSAALANPSDNVAINGSANTEPSANSSSASTGTSSSATSATGSSSPDAGTTHVKPSPHTASSDTPSKPAASGSVSAHIPSMSEAQALLSPELTKQKISGSSSRNASLQGLLKNVPGQPASSGMLEKLRQMYMASRPKLAVASSAESVNGTSSGAESLQTAGSAAGSRVTSLSSSQDLLAPSLLSPGSQPSQPSSDDSSNTAGTTTTSSSSHP